MILVAAGGSRKLSGLRSTSAVLLQLFLYLNVETRRDFIRLVRQICIIHTVHRALLLLLAMANKGSLRRD